MIIIFYYIQTYFYILSLKTHDLPYPSDFEELLQKSDRSAF